MITSEQDDKESESSQGKYYLISETSDSSSTSKSPLQLENIYTKLIKYTEKLLQFILKWKSKETNRSSFSFNISEVDRIKHDKDSERLRTLLDVCTESLVYVCYKLHRLNECVLFMELTDFIFRTNSTDLESIYDLSSTNFLPIMNLFFKSNLNQLNTRLLRYKFLFDSRLIYIFLIQPNSSTEFKILSSQKFRLNNLICNLDLTFNMNHVKLVNSSKFEYLYKKFEIIQNEWVKANLNDIEYRHAPAHDSSLDLIKVRIKNRLKECNYFHYMLKMSGGDETSAQHKYEFQMSTVDLINLKLSDKLNDTLNAVSLTSAIGSSQEEVQSSSLSSLSLEQSLEQLNQIFYSIIIKPVAEILDKTSTQSDHSTNILIESKYVKAFTYVFNLFQEKRSNFDYLLIFDSFLKQSTSCLISFLKDINQEKHLAKERKKIIDTPNRSKKISSKLEDVPAVVRVKKSEVVPRLTSNPRLAVNMLNEHPELDHIEMRNDHVQRVKDRLDKSITTLITETVSGTDAKRSTLEIIDFKQVQILRY